MKGFSAELKVGLFMLLGIAAFLFMTFKIGWITFSTGKSQTYFVVYFNNISGVAVKSHVKMAGVKIGEVNSIELENKKAKVTISLDTAIIIPEDSIATVRSSGLLGEKYIDIRPGDSKRMLETGDVLAKSVDPADIDDMVAKLSAALDDIKLVTASLRDSFGTEEGKKGLQDIIKNFSSISKSLDKIITGNEKRLSSIIGNVDKASLLLQEILAENRKSFKSTLANFEKFSTSLADKAPDLLANLDAAAVGIRGVVDDNRENLKEGIANFSGILKENRENFKTAMENLKNSSEKLEEIMDNIKQVSAKLEKGEGTIGKLIQDEEIYDSLNVTLAGAKGFVRQVNNIKIGLGARTERQFELDETKSYFSIRIQPREDKYYLGEITQDVRNPNKPEGSNALDSLLYTFLIAKRYGDANFRIGLMESSGGVGFDYYAFRERLTLSADLFNFSGYDKNATNPQVKLTARFYPQKYIFLQIGGDELFNDYYSTFFAGAGIMADEDDFKFFLSLF